MSSLVSRSSFTRFGQATLLGCGGLIALSFSPFPETLKRGTKDLMDHWKVEKVVIKEVPVIQEKIVEKEVPVIQEKIVEKEVPVIEEKIIYRDIEADPKAPAPLRLPADFVTHKDVNVRRMANAMEFQSKVTAAKGGLASKERLTKAGYQATLEMKVKLPKANRTLGELATVNRWLPSMLPGLASMLPGAKVSGFYPQLYNAKVKHLQVELAELDQALSRHNFYDCETMLELTHPKSGQKVLMIQADMDVVADGSDGDRQSTFDLSLLESPSFQPATSYRWPKRTNRPNPLLVRYQRGLVRAKEYLKTAKGSEKSRMEHFIKTYPNIIASMKKESYLISHEDPFIVISTATRPYVDKHPFTPRIGDYAVVIYQNRLYPAICGDYGPDIKVGEASLRLAKELNPKATPKYRPVSDLAVTYLIFPNSRDLPAGPPDLEKWHRQCAALLKSIGGLGENYHLHQWVDRLARGSVNPLEP